MPEFEDKAEREAWIRGTADAHKGKSVNPYHTEKKARIWAKARRAEIEKTVKDPCILDADPNGIGEPDPQVQLG